MAAPEDAQARILALVDQLTDVLWEVDFDGRATYVSPGVRGLLGLEPADLEAQDLARLLVPGSDSAVEEALVRVLVRREDRFSGVQVALLHAEGREVWVELSGVLMRDAEGHPKGFQGVARDVTLRRQMEAALRQSTKMQSLGLLAGGVAHGFNNLLQALLGHLEVLAHHTREREDLAGTCERMRGVIRRAEGIAHRMEAFAFGGATCPGPLDLAGELQRLEPLLRASLPGRVTLLMDSAPGLGRVQADDEGLTRILLDLLSNAVTSLGEAPGRVQVRVAEAPSEAFGESLWVLPPPELPGPVLEVRDDGPGIPGAILVRIFDPFFSTHLEGRGLGLASVQGLARGYGAGLRVCSAAGEGACFSLVFPRFDSSLT